MKRRASYLATCRCKGVRQVRVYYAPRLRRWVVVLKGIGLGFLREELKAKHLWTRGADLRGVRIIGRYSAGEQHGPRPHYEFLWGLAGLN